MAEVITMLALSPTMEEGTIAEWFKEEGEDVEEGEVIAEVETDKAAMEMESFFEGKVLKVLVKKGDTVKVGAPMAVIGEAGEDADAALAALGGAPAPAAESPTAEAAAAAPAPEAATAPAPDAPAGDARIKSSPLARKMAQEAGLDLSTIAGSGPHGRIIKRDIEDAIANKATSAPAPQAAAPLAATIDGTPGFLGPLPDAGATMEPLTQMRKAIARRMTQVWSSTPFFYLTLEIDMAQAMSQRKELNKKLADAGIQAKLSVNDMIVKACALALKEFPRMNCAYAGDEIAYFDEVHIGVAVALEDGLITPTIRNADKKSLTAISTETRELAGKARDRKLKPNEYGGSTFSISNLGMYGIDHFQAVINPPESGILACGAVQQVPVVQEGELTVGTRMKVTLTCDHRAVDGAIGAQFLQRVQKYLENPVLLFI